MEKSKLLAAVAVLAMVVCVFAVAMPSEDVDAEVTTPGDATSVTYEQMQAWTSSTTGNFKLSGEVELKEKTTLTIPKGVSLYTETKTLDASAAQLIVNGQLYVNGTGGTLIIGGTQDANCIFYGKVVVDENGTVKIKNSTIGEITYVGANGVANVTSGTIEIVENEVIGFTVTLVKGSTMELSGQTSLWQTDSLVVEESANLNVKSDVTMRGTVTNNGAITVDTGKTLTNNGTFTNNGEFTNNGTVTNVTNTNLTYKATITNNGTFTSSGTLTNNATITNNKDVTISGTANLGDNYVNNGTTEVGSADVTGTITNNGTVSTTAKNSGLTIDGGEMTFTSLDDAKKYMPKVTTGTILNIANKNYTANVSSSNDYTLVFGVPAPEYDPAKDYAGNPSVDIVVLNVKDAAGNIFEFDTATVTILGEAITPGEDGKVTAAGTYGMTFTVSVTVYKNNVVVTNTYTTVNGVFTILPKTLTGVKIVGTGEGGNFPPVYYDGGKEVWLQPEDFKVVYTIEGKEVELFLDQDYTYECVSADGKWVGNAKIVVTLINNYTTKDVIDATYIISKKLDEMIVEPNDETAKYYVGEEISTADFKFTVKYDDGTSDNINSGDIKIVGSQYYGVPGEDGKYIVEFSYAKDDYTVNGFCAVTVIPIEKIEVTENTTANQNYKSVYDAGESFTAEGMTITVTYVAQEGEQTRATAVFNYADTDPATGFALTDGGSIKTNSGVTLSTGFVFSYGVFDDAIGDVDVSVTYFGAQDTFTVTVNGFLATYMYTNEDGVLAEYGTQIGIDGKLAAVFNYTEASPEGKSFSGWLIEGTNAVYQPGDVYAFGEDDRMWADGEITFIAQYGDAPVVDPVYSEDIIVGIYKSDDDGIVITLTARDGNVIPAGKIEVNYTYMVWNETRNTFMPDYGILTEDVDEGKTFVEFPVINVTGFDTIIGLTVTFNDVYSNSAIYEVILEAPVQ